MAKTKVDKDKHGIFVRTNGCVYRPVETQFSYPIFQCNVRKDGTSSYSDGETVKVTNVARAPFCKVLNPVQKHEEWWHSHGPYMSNKTEKCWVPKKQK